MDVFELKELIKSEDCLYDMLLELDLYNVKNYTSEVRCGICETGDGGGTALRVKKETLKFNYFGQNNFPEHGDIITLIQTYKSYTFSETISWICNFLGISTSNIQHKKTQLPFGGFYRKAKFKQSQIDESPPKEIYGESVLGDFTNVGNIRFLQDGISLIVQKQFDIMYDLWSNRITVPWRNTNGDIIGIMGRYNSDELDFNGRDIAKWYPIIPFKKSFFLYGLFENYTKIQESGVLYVGESEKFVMQLATMGYRNAVAVGSHSITPYQVKLIRSLGVNKVIICFDNDIGEDVLQSEANKLEPISGLLTMDVGYVKDKNGIYLRDKESPADKGKIIFDKLIKECVVDE